MADTIVIKGLTALQRDLRTLDKNLSKEMLRAGKDAAGIVVDDAAPRAPVLSGALRGTLKAVSTQTGARAVAGGSLPYTGPIYGGWPKHNIAPHPFLDDAFDAKHDDVVDAYAQAVSDLIDRTIHDGIGA